LEKKNRNRNPLKKKKKNLLKIFTNMILF
jgi:hypothetical protein